MRLLVVTPTLGTSATLAETLASVATCGLTIEHVVVAPARALAELREKYPGTCFVAEQSTGLYAALNTGIAAATTDWDWFSYLNDDDVWISAGMRTACDQASGATAADVTYGRVRILRENGSPAGELPVARAPADLEALLARGIIPFAQPGMLVRRTLLARLGGFDTSFRLAGDLDLAVRALRAGAGFAFVPQIVAGFRLRAGQLSKDEAAVVNEKDRALAPLQTSGPYRTKAALFRFRLGNLGAYLARLRHHGWVRMSEVYRRA